MERVLDSDVSLGRWYVLPSGLRVRLRLAQRRDLPRIQLLLHALGCDDQLEGTRLVRFDPRRRVVVVATALIDGAEMLVGIGALNVGALTSDTLAVDPSNGDGLPELLGGALRTRAAAISSRPAA